MLINRNGIICHISKTNSPYQLWYPINLLIPQFGDNYVEEKLGVTDPDHVKRLQDEFLEALPRSNDKSEYLKTNIFRFDKTDFAFYLADITESSVTIYIELLLSTEAYDGAGRCPRGYVWARITKKDTPETLGEKFYTTNKRFAKALHKKLWEMMGW
jgi:hypothetical protein